VEDRGFEPLTALSESYDSQSFTSTGESSLAYSLACQFEKDPNLKLLVERWPYLPEAIRAGIAAMVKAASASESKEAP
jgi:hypothetical protein